VPVEGNFEHSRIAKASVTAKHDAGALLMMIAHRLWRDVASDSTGPMDVCNVEGRGWRICHLNSTEGRGGRGRNCIVKVWAWGWGGGGDGDGNGMDRWMITDA
ncbi:hypothetical protein Ancab_023391, partial [Ancistrocladus abbreviatus]